MSEPSDRQRANLELNKEGFDAFIRSDGERVFEVTATDVEIHSSPELANSGDFSGHDGYARWLSEWLEAWDDFELTVTATEPVGQRHVVTSVRQSAKGKGSGIPVEMSLAFMAEFGDGKFTALHLYPDAEAARRVAREREKPARG